MTIDETIKHLEFSKKSYQNLIDNDTRIGEAVGKDTTGTWKADTSLATVYQTMRDTMVVAIRSIEAWEKVKAEIDEIEKKYGLDKATKYGNENAEQQRSSYSTMMMYEVADLVDDIKDIIDKHLKEVEE